MLPVRSPLPAFSRLRAALPRLPVLLAALLATWLLAGCAAKRVDFVEAPPEVLSWDGVYKEETFTNPEGLGIFGRFWYPEGKPRAAVMILHGTSLHSGTYEDFGRYLAARGYLAYAMDMQGWGRSEGAGKRGDAINHDKYVTDVGVMLSRLREDYPDTPVFGFGESLGGMICLLGQAQRRTYFDGLILSSPAYKPSIRLPLGIHLPEILYQWVWSLGNFAGPLSPEWVQTLPAVPSNIGLRYTVTDPVKRGELLDDPYVTHTWLPLRYIGGIAQSAVYLRKNIETINVPLYLLHSEKDQLVPVASSKEIVQRAISRDRRIKVYPDAAHAVFIQRERYEAMIDAVKWLDDRTAPRKPSPYDLDVANHP